MLPVSVFTGNAVNYDTLQDMNMKLLLSKCPAGENPFPSQLSLLPLKYVQSTSQITVSYTTGFYAQSNTINI